MLSQCTSEPTSPTSPRRMLTVLEEARTISHALKAGEDGYLLKGMDPDEFLARMRGIPLHKAPRRRP